jgi:flagellar biosynthetic protein FliR
MESEFLQQLPWHAWLPALVRVGALVFTLPLLSGSAVPVRCRLALVVALAIVIAPGVPQESGSASGWSPADLVSVLFNEALIGASMGVSAQVILAGARLAGNLIENVCGISFAVPEATPGDEGSTAVVRLFWWTTAAVFVACGGATAMVQGAIQSFQTCPPGTRPFDAGLLEFVTGAVANGMEFGLRAALPGLAAVLVATGIVAMTLRSCPQLAGMQVGLGIQTVAGLLVTSLLLVSAPWLINGGMESAWQELQHVLEETTADVQPSR